MIAIIDESGVLQPKFSLGQLVITRNAADTIAPKDVAQGIFRHGQGDWGDLDEEDKQENERALKYGSRLFSAYHDSNGTKFWIITEYDRSLTTVLLPEDY
jgi:hypothetical protein